MIRKFEILNEKYNDELNGYLSYDTEKCEFSMKLLSSYDKKHPEVFFMVLHKHGVLNVPNYLVDNWVQSRVIPPNRQGLNGVLHTIGLNEYDLFDLLIYNKGRCHMDSLYLKEVD